jgi:hypothetical protein
MSKNAVLFTNSKKSKIVLLVSIAAAFFWIAANIINVYHFAAVGAIFEILWMPVIVITIALPVVAFISWAKEKFNIRSFYLYAIFIIIAAGALVKLKLL